MSRATIKSLLPARLQLGINAPRLGDVFQYAGIYEAGVTTDSKGIEMLARMNGLPDGTKRDVRRYVKGGNVGVEVQVALAEALVRRYNAFEALVEALDMATATVELGTGKGAQSQPKGWPKDASGSIDVAAVAARCRALLAEVK